MVQQAPQVEPNVMPMSVPQQPQVIPNQIRRLPVNNEVPSSAITPVVPVAPVASITPREEAPRIEMSNVIPVQERLPNLPVFAPPAALMSRASEPAAPDVAAAKPMPAPAITAVASSPATPAAISAAIGTCGLMTQKGITCSIWGL